MEEKKPTPMAPPAPALTDEAIGAYLRQHPDFLVRHPEIAPLLTPPSRGDGDRVVDFGRFLIDRLRAEIAALSARESRLMATVESNVTGQGRIHRAILKLLSASDAASFARAVEVDLLAILELQAATLCLAPELAARLALGGRGVVLPADRIARLMSTGREASLRPAQGGDRDVFADAPDTVRSLALLRIVLGRDLPPGLLVLGSRRSEAFQPHHGTDLLVFLARVVELCLRRWLTPPP